MMLKNISRAVRVARCNTGHGEAGPKPALQCAGLALWGGFCLSRIFMFYLLLFYLFYFQRAIDHDFSRHIYVPKFGAKVLPPRGRVCGRAVRCVWKSIRSLLPRLSTVLRESREGEKARSPTCALTIKNQSRHYDKWALCKHVRNNWRANICGQFHVYLTCLNSHLA